MSRSELRLVPDSEARFDAEARLRGTVAAPVARLAPCPALAITQPASLGWIPLQTDAELVDDAARKVDGRR